MELDKNLLDRIIVDDKMTSRETVAEKYNLGIRAASYYWFIAQNYKAIINTPDTERRVLIIGDLHAPFIREGYLEFCQSIYNKYDCNEVMFVGDLIDNHYSSYHESDPDGHSAGLELDKAKVEIAKWYKAFPIANVCIGNHDIIPERKAMTAGLSKHWIKPISEVIESPNWKFAEEFIIDDNKYCHGTGRKARGRAKDDLMSVIQGHYHSEGYIEYFVGQRYKIFAMQVGCGVDGKSYAMAYGKPFKKMHVSCGVMLEDGNLPILEFMDL
jgi:metallophosphoesterase superfamily enzyme